MLHNKKSLFEIIITLMEKKILTIWKKEIKSWKKILLILLILILFIFFLYLAYKYLIIPLFAKIFVFKNNISKCGGSNSKPSSAERLNEQNLNKDQILKEIEKKINEETEYYEEKIEKIKKENEIKLDELTKKFEEKIKEIDDKVEKIKDDQKYKYEYNTKEMLDNREKADEAFKKEEDTPFSHNEPGGDFDSTTNMIRAGKTAEKWKGSGEGKILNTAEKAVKIASIVITKKI